MASVSSIRSKEWRAKRKDDAEYWEQERKRKWEARQSRSEEQKQHDRELSKKRQKRFRDRKKSAKCNVPVLPLDIAIDNNEDRIPAISDDVGSTGELTTSNPSTFHVSMDTDLEKGPADSVCKSADIEGEDSPVFLYNVDGNNWHKKSKPLTKQFCNKGAESMAAISINGNEGREAYFERIQATLSAVEDFDLLQIKCNEFSNHIEEMYPIGNIPTLDMTKYQLDNVASSLYPHEDAPDDFVPIQTIGDGNCLPRVGSLFAFGNEKHHNEIRVRMFIELCRHERYYLDDSYLKRGTEQGIVNIAKTLALFSDVFVSREEDGVKLAFRYYVKNILKTNSFNGMWSIFALSSVLGVQVSSIYPSYGGYNVRPHLHRLVLPRVLRQEKSLIIHIMWTSTNGKQLEPKSWTPNHFVAVLPTRDVTPTLREKGDLPMQPEQSGSHPVTNSISSTIPVLGSGPIESLLSNYDEFEESPTTRFLNSVCKRDATIGTNDKSLSRTAVLAPTDHMNIGEPTRVNNRFLSLSDKRNISEDLIEEHGAMDPRTEDRCPSHSTEQLVYLCTTCGALPICYKCHLESHQQHTFEDLKKCLEANERIYLQKITKEHEDDLKKKIKQQKQVHVENMEYIDKEIETVFAHYKDLLEKKSKSGKNNECQIRILESMLEDTYTFTEKERARLKSLPVRERLSVMTEEPRPDDITKRQPLAHLMLCPGPGPSLDQFGPLAEIPYHAGNQYQWNKAPGDKRIHVSLMTDYDPGMSGGSTVSGFPGQTYVHSRGSILPDNTDPVNRVTTDTCKNVMPLKNHGLKEGRTSLASQMSTHMEIAATNDTSVISTQTYPHLSYENATYNHHTQSIPLSNHNDQHLNHGISTLPIWDDQPLSYRLQTDKTLELQPVGNGTLALSTDNDQPPVYGIRTMAPKHDQSLCVETTVVEFPSNLRVNAIPTVPTFTDQQPIYTRPDTLRQNGGSQTIHQQHREQMMFNPEESGLGLQPTDTAVDNTMLRHHGFRAASEIEPDTWTQETKHKLTLGIEHRQIGLENVNLVKSDSNNTDNNTVCVRESDSTGYVIVKRTVIDMTHEIMLPCIYWNPDVFRSVGNMLYVWDSNKANEVLQIDKDSVQHNIIKLKSRNVCHVCVSPIDNTVWFVCFDGKVRCVTTTGREKTKFRVKYWPESICVTCAGDVLVEGPEILTMYTDSGEVLHSIECIGEGRMIRECSRTRNIVIVLGFSEEKIIFYDHSLKRKFSIEDRTVTYSDGHRSDVGYGVKNIYGVCFDKQGNILVGCNYYDIILVDHTNGQYIKTLPSDRDYMRRFDIDDEGVMWVLNKNKVKRIQL